MSDEIDLLDDNNVLRTIAVTLLQIRDYQAAILVSLASTERQLEKTADMLEDIHAAGGVMLPPPFINDARVVNDERTTEEDLSN